VNAGGDYTGPQVFRAACKGALFVLIGGLLCLLSCVLYRDNIACTSYTHGWPFSAYQNLCPCLGGDEKHHVAWAGLVGNVAFWTAVAAASYWNPAKLARRFSRSRSATLSVNDGPAAGNRSRP